MHGIYYVLHHNLTMEQVTEKRYNEMGSFWKEEGTAKEIKRRRYLLGRKPSMQLCMILCSIMWSRKLQRMGQKQLLCQGGMI